ncbi:uncharacterized protein LOC134795852 [Cydia splendana]|uniref:uncharacterized protein LOC134795852 n=1 Tax=Cydia splendana TaxID=1100963 RepID=UPI00300C474F
MSELGQYVRRAEVDIALLQEPYAWKNRVAGLGHLGGALYYEGNGELPPRACIYVSNKIRNMGCVMTLCYRDLVVVETYFMKEDGKRYKVALASCYLPGDGVAPTKELEETVLWYRGKQEDLRRIVWECRRDSNLQLQLQGTGLNERDKLSTARLLPAGRPYTTSTSKYPEVSLS